MSFHRHFSDEYGLNLFFVDRNKYDMMREQIKADEESEYGIEFNRAVV